MSFKVRLLGVGGSIGVPGTGGFWGDCNPKEPKNNRRRAALLVQSAETNVLVDTPVDIREQLNDCAPINHIDGIIYTHAHSDHINGMDDMRIIYKQMKKPIDIYTNQASVDGLLHRFTYVFEGDGPIYPPLLKPHVIKDNSVTIGDLDFQIFVQDHGSCESLGIRIGDFAYSTDVFDLDEAAFAALEGVKTWVVDAQGFWEGENCAHACIPKVMKWVERLKPEITYLTDLTVWMDYNKLCEDLPPHIRPAYDGLELEF